MIFLFNFLSHTRIAGGLLFRMLRVLNRLKPITTKRTIEFHLSFLVTWRRSTLPGPCGPSTIDTGELNFCVRDGNRCMPLRHCHQILRSIISFAFRRQAASSCAHVCFYTLRLFDLDFLVLLGPDDTLLFTSSAFRHRLASDASRFDLILSIHIKFQVLFSCLVSSVSCLRRLCRRVPSKLHNIRFSLIKPSTY